MEESAADIGETIQKMMVEDSWLRSDNSSVFFIHSVLPKGISITDIIDVSIVKSAELDTVSPDYKNSAALHCFLATLYQSLPEELSDEFKREIELEKLKREEDPRLFECRNMSPAEIAKAFSDETVHIPLEGGRQFAVNLKAPTAYIHLSNIRVYMSSNNSFRVHRHFNEALELSGDNPTAFKHLIEPRVLAYITLSLVGEITQQHHDRLQNHNLVYPLLGLFNDAYKSAKQRVETYQPQSRSLLPPISTTRPTPLFE